MTFDDLEQFLGCRNAARFQLGPNRNVVQRNLERPGRYELQEEVLIEGVSKLN